VNKLNNHSQFKSNLSLNTTSQKINTQQFSTFEMSIRDKTLMSAKMGDTFTNDTILKCDTKKWQNRTLGEILEESVGESNSSHPKESNRNKEFSLPSKRGTIGERKMTVREMMMQSKNFTFCERKGIKYY
jgi:hypothetical protein